MNAYYFLSRLASPFVTASFYLYNLLTDTPRTRVVVRNEAGEVLLLQVWPDTSIWSLPGGGLERGERPESAAARELREETGIEVLPGLMRAGTAFYSRGHQELVYHVTVPKDSLPASPPNRFEVRRTAWFALGSLPRLPVEARRIIAEVAAQH